MAIQCSLFVWVFFFFVFSFFFVVVVFLFFFFFVFFAVQNVSSFCIEKAINIFAAKISRYLKIPQLQQLMSLSQTTSLSLRCFEQLGPGNNLVKLTEV